MCMYLQLNILDKFWHLVRSLPICRPRQHCFCVCDALIEAVIPPSHPAHHEGSVHDQYINRVYYELIGGVDEDEIGMSGRNVVGTHPYAHPQHIKVFKHLLYI